MLLAIVFWAQAASSTDYDAIAAARQFFVKLDRGDFRGAWDQFSAAAKAAVAYDAWLGASVTSDPIVSRRFTKTVTYDLPEGKLIAVEFDGMSGSGDKECGYIVVDPAGSS